MKELFCKIRFWFFDLIGKRVSIKTYIGHGDYTEEIGWQVGKRFIRC